MAVQAWALRRMISTYNSIVRRPHVPRERGLRRIMIAQGIDVPLDTPPRETERAPSDHESDMVDEDEEESAEGSDLDEEMEESSLENDEECF